MKYGCSFLMAALLFFGASARPIFSQEPALPAAGSVGQKVTLQFQETDILEVLKVLADQAGLNLAAGRDVSGRVTLFLKEVDPWEALEVILASNGLAYERNGNILCIVTQREYEEKHGAPYQDRRQIHSIRLAYAKAADVARALTQVKSNIGRVIADEPTNTLILMDTPDLVKQMEELAQRFDQPVQTRIFSLNHADPKTVAALLQEKLSKGMGELSMDERTKRISVTDYPAKLEEIGRMISAFDERSAQVLIEAKILQVTLSDRFQLGIDWQTLVNDKVKLKGLNSLGLTSGGVVSVATAALSQKGDYSILLQALRTYGDARILSEPRLTVIDSQEARILVGSREPFVTKSVSQTGTGTAVTAESVTYLDIGIKLYVTPSIARDGFIRMKVRPEVSSRTGSLTTSEKNEIPIIETAEAETSLLVEDGNTVILGGLIKDEKSIAHNRIPVLGDIPFFGMLFRSNNDLKKKTELVVLLTPHIITGGKESPAPPIN